MASDDSADTSVSAFSKRMREAQASGAPAQPLPKVGAGGGGFGPQVSGGGATLQSYGVSRPTQADLEEIVDARAALAAESVWDDEDDLAVHALLHRAILLEMERKGWNVSTELGSVHVKTLRMAQAVIRLIPKREPIA